MEKMKEDMKENMKENMEENMEENMKKNMKKIKKNGLSRLHLRFKHAQPKICHSPKVEDGVEN